MIENLLFRPEDTPWEGGTFKLSLSFSDQYPKVAPKVVFLSKIFHPNVYGDGRICLDILDVCHEQKKERKEDE